MLLVVAQPAAAHELGIVLVVPPGTEDATAESSLDGFRLAVDQSPDVSHPPGPDAGDHLGGIDVDLTVVAAGDRRDAALRAARVVSSGAAVVVVQPGPRGAADRGLTADLLSRVRPRNPLVVVAGSRATLPARLPLPVVLLRDRPTARLDRARVVRFERQFARRHRRRPGRVARTGYDAGRLLDRLLARLGEGPYGAPPVAAAARAADRTLVAGTAELVREHPDRGDASTPPAGTADGATATVIAVAAASAAAGLLAVPLVRLARRRRHVPRP